MLSFHTVGHGAASAAELGDVLETSRVKTVVDVRRYPGSRRHPQYNRDAMSAWLPERGIDYRWVEALGGRRRPSSDSVNRGLRNDQFRAYADYMATSEFRAAVADLVELAAGTQVAMMCAESLWWRCHRRLIADHLVLVEAVAVRHLMHDGTATAHPVTPGAVRAGNRVIYEESHGQEALFDDV